MSNEVAENLREIASNLLATANRLDGIDVSADAMRDGTVYVPPGYGVSTGDGGGQVLRCLRCSGWERPLFGAPGDLHAWVRLHDNFRHSVGGTVRIDNSAGSTVRVNNGDGSVSFWYNAVLSVPSGFAVGADRDGTVGMRCVLTDWCSWEHEPEDNELTTEQIAEQATAHVAEKHSPGA